MSLTAERLRELLDYNAETGKFTWRVSNSNRVRARSIAGRPHPRGCWVIGVDGKIYKAHRLAWLYVFGKWPSFHLDHRDGDACHNWIENLRPANHAQNARNMRRRNSNKIGLKGVSRANQKWQARITVNSKGIYLGVFDTPEAAHAAYVTAAERLFGDFARAE